MPDGSGVEDVVVVADDHEAIATVENRPLSHAGISLQI